MPATGSRRRGRPRESSPCPAASGSRRRRRRTASRCCPRRCAPGSPSRQRCRSAGATSSATTVSRSRSTTSARRRRTRCCTSSSASRQNELWRRRMRRCRRWEQPGVPRRATDRDADDEERAVSNETLKQLSDAGVSIWLDDLSRERLVRGTLAELLRDKHVVGVTTNPSIFQKAISGSEIYDDQIRDLARRKVDIGEALRAITTYDVRWGCDVLRPAYDASDGVDGRVSIEVDPRISGETERTIAEARALWWLVDRPNLFIKIPATVPSLPAISQCLAEGISINVTLVFSLERYGEVIDAFFDGLERARATGRDLSHIGSVASFFVSRVDSEVDKRLDKIGTDEAKALRGKAAIANARLAYELYEEKFGSDRWKALEAAGAKPQRPLWASTSTKDPAYDDTMYVIDLVAPGTVNTMPEPTLDALVDHGEFRGDTVRGAYVDAHGLLDKLAEAGIEYDDVVRVLEEEAIDKFETSWNELIESIESELERLAGEVNTAGPDAADKK